MVGHTHPDAAAVHAIILSLVVCMDTSVRIVKL